jgi:nucleotide-binding universal stress UspA family protein
VPTLLVPQRVSGFVDDATGALALRRVLFPVAPQPRPEAAVDRTHGLLAQLGFAGPVEVLHVGDSSSMPGVDLPTGNGMDWRRRAVAGEVVPTILAEAEATATDLIVMPTEGHHGFLDALRGSTTERVLRGATCPVLALPAGMVAS